MEWKKFQLTERGTETPVMPITHESCVIDDEGNSLVDKLVECKENSQRLDQIESDIYTDPFNGHEYVDMGEAGIWAKYPVGVSEWDDKIFDEVKYFAWGDTQGYKISQIPSEKFFNYDFADYIFSGEGSTSTNPQLTKYCSQSNLGKNGFVDNLKELLPEDDAVHINMGGNWRMPSQKDFVNLCDLCDYEIVKNWQGKNINGVLFKLKIDNSKQLFLPIPGYCSQGGRNGLNDYGYYLCSNIGQPSTYGCSLNIYTTSITPTGGTSRCGGYPVIGILGSNDDKPTKFYTKQEVNKKFDNAATKKSVQTINNWKNNNIIVIPYTGGSLGPSVSIGQDNVQLGLTPYNLGTKTWTASGTSVQYYKIPSATTKVAGVLSASDKSFIDKISTLGGGGGTFVGYNGQGSLHLTADKYGLSLIYGSAYIKNGVTTVDPKTLYLPSATSESYGIMSPDDKSKLDSIDLSNVEATKLKTPIKLWGQEFDGSKDITGPIIVDIFESNDIIKTPASDQSIIKYDYNSDELVINDSSSLGVNIKGNHISLSGDSIYIKEDTEISGEFGSAVNFGTNIIAPNITAIESKLEGVTKAADDSKVIKTIYDASGGVTVSPKEGTLTIDLGIGLNSDNNDGILVVDVDTNVIATKESVDGLKQSVDLLINGETANDAFDTLKEVDTWIKSHEKEAADLVSDVNDLKNQVSIASIQSGDSGPGYSETNIEFKINLTNGEYDWFTIGPASKINAGLMTASDKTKLDSIEVEKLYTSDNLDVSEFAKVDYVSNEIDLVNYAVQQAQQSVGQVVNLLTDNYYTKQESPKCWDLNQLFNKGYNFDPGMLLDGQILTDTSLDTSSGDLCFPTFVKFKVDFIPVEFVFQLTNLNNYSLSNNYGTFIYKPTDTLRFTADTRMVTINQVTLTFARNDVILDISSTVTNR